MPDEVESLIERIEMSIAGRRGGRDLLNPLSPIVADGQEAEPYHDTLDNLLSALHHLRASGYEPPSSLNRYHEELPLSEGMVQAEPFSLVAVSMPPEMYEGASRRDGSEGQTGGMRFFGDEVVLPPDTTDGWTLRSLVLDTIHIFEINRKECARILLTLPTFLVAGTFKSAESPSTLSLESLVVSTILSTLLTLPTPPHKPVYYGSVLTELCKLSPSTVAPPVGKAVRKVFTRLGSDGLDVEVVRRTADWFAIHLSNFGFQWMWKEWIPDLVLPASHPKRAFMRRVVELEIRLAYHDRIMQTLPDEMLTKEANVISADPPEPVWPYEKDAHPLHAEATELLKLLRQKVPVPTIKSHLDGLPDATSGPDEPLSPEIRLMAFQTLLHLGSRSFSHFLNATERYLDLLRQLTPDPSTRRVLLDGVTGYWKESSQMVLVVVDKYLQYGVLEGLDVVEWVFGEELRSGGGEDGDGWTDCHKWEILRMTIDKTVGRVEAAKRRVRDVERGDEVARARRAAEKLERGEDVGMDEGDSADAPPERSSAAQEAQTSLDIQASRAEKVLLAIIKHFVKTLLPWAFEEGSEGGLKSVLQLLDGGEEGWWSVRSQFGWWREFVRLYEPHLAQLDSVVETTIWSRLTSETGSLEGRAEVLVRGVWSAICGEE
ncbi:nuclear cap-binding protein subunit 1, partial [Tremellales sp. Uapishka_1]